MFSFVFGAGVPVDVHLHVHLLSWSWHSKEDSSISEPVGLHLVTVAFLTMDRSHLHCRASVCGSVSFLKLSSVSDTTWTHLDQLSYQTCINFPADQTSSTPVCWLVKLWVAADLACVPAHDVLSSPLKVALPSEILIPHWLQYSVILHRFPQNIIWHIWYLWIL